MIFIRLRKLRLIDCFLLHCLGPWDPPGSSLAPTCGAGVIQEQHIRSAATNEPLYGWLFDRFADIRSVQCGYILPRITRSSGNNRAICVL